MCGIAGLIWRDTNRRADAARVQVMTDMIAHRGPDADGVWCEGPVGLGHRRLSILDLSDAGRQPMESGDGELVITFNGEIYNYLELREELAAAGRKFHTGTDTEVILQAFRAWGPRCVERLNGMWALAIVDRKSREVFLSRDRVGIKPLYYSLDEEAFAFCSEIKGILAMFSKYRRPNEATIRHFLPGGVLDDGPETFFEGIVNLPAAHNATYSIDQGALKLHRYWDVSAASQQDPLSDRQAVESLQGLLQSSVSLHLRSDVPVGTCLSGGVDSSGLVCLMGREISSPIHTFSGLYPDAECDESAFAQAINRHVLTTPHPVRPDPGPELLDDLASITWHQDMPSAGPGLYTQFRVMQRACEQVKVILDGQGSDELFAGYLPYFSTYLNDRSATGVAERVRSAGVLISLLWHHGSGQFSSAWHGVLGRRLGGVAARLAGLRRSAKSARTPPPLFETSFEARVSNGLERSVRRRFPDGLTDQLYQSVVQSGLPALLHYEDRNSMAFSIEARVPFLDYRIIELAFRLRPDQKLRGTWTKWVLRKALEPFMPSMVTWRRSKLGYPTPFGRWLRREAIRDRAAEILFSGRFVARKIVNPDRMKYEWDSHQAGADHSWMLWRLLTLELWYRHFIDDLKPIPARATPQRTAQQEPVLTTSSE